MGPGLPCPSQPLLVPMAGGLWLSRFPEAWQKEILVLSGLFLDIGLYLFFFVLPSFFQRLYRQDRLEAHSLPFGVGSSAGYRLGSSQKLSGCLAGDRACGLGLWRLAFSLMLMLDALQVACRRTQFHLPQVGGGSCFPGGFYLTTLGGAGLGAAGNLLALGHLLHGLGQPGGLVPAQGLAEAGW